MTTQQPEALRLSELLTADEWPGNMTLVSYARACVAELRRQHARIAELEAQLASIGAASAPADSVPKARFDDPKVQAVYAILCEDAEPPKGEHWEGFAARRIVDALSADSVLEDAARLKEAVALLEELAEHDNYSTEYDGRMLSICPECCEQDGKHRPKCAFVRAKAFLSARKQGANHD